MGSNRNFPPTAAVAGALASSVSHWQKGKMTYGENPIIALIAIILDAYWWVVLVAVIMSWLVAFNVINVHNNLARSVLRLLYALTEPVFRQIRKVIPPIAGLDLSPLVVFFFITWMLFSVLPWLNNRFFS
jgi:YggT family protein